MIKEAVEALYKPAVKAVNTSITKVAMLLRGQLGTRRDVTYLRDA
jgi:ribosomal protein L23